MFAIGVHTTIATRRYVRKTEGLLHESLHYFHTGENTSLRATNDLSKLTYFNT